MAIRTETTNRFEEINPPALGAPRGFNHGLLVRPGWGLLFVAGQTAASTAGVVGDVAFVSQFTEALQKTIAVVQAAGGSAEHIVRMTVYVTDMDAYRESRASLDQRLAGIDGPPLPGDGAGRGVAARRSRRHRRDSKRPPPAAPHHLNQGLSPWLVAGIS